MHVGSEQYYSVALMAVICFTDTKYLMAIVLSVDVMLCENVRMHNDIGL